MSKSTTVSIAPSESSNKATIVRAIVNEAHARARMHDKSRLAGCMVRLDEAIQEYKDSLWAVCDKR